MTGLIKQANEFLYLWRNFGPDRPDIDLNLLFKEIILKKAGGAECDIVFAPFDSFEGLMALDEETGHWRIGVNTNITYLPRRNFTLAHEIGHFVGHRTLRKRFECTFENLTDFQRDKLEIEANNFASQLLMPPDVVRSLTSERPFNHESVSEISGLLNVSRAALAYRWIHLSNRTLGFVISRDGFICNGRASDQLYRRGTFFRGGEELPENAALHHLSNSGQSLTEMRGRGIWNEHLSCMENSYATRQGDYIYTYLEFEKA